MDHNPIIQNPKSKIQNKNEAGQASLVALLVGMVIIGVLVWVFLFRHDDGDSPRDKDAKGAIVRSDKKTIPGMAMDQGKGVECAQYLSQVRMAVTMERDNNDGAPPQSIQSISGIPGEMEMCPASNRPYGYDPRTGQVRCVTPGHEKL